MAGGRWKMIRTRFAKLTDMVLVLSDVMDGDCIKEFDKAREQCDRDLQRRKGVADRKPGEVFPVSVESCAKATAALRKCMESKNVLAKHFVAMDLGIEQDEGRRLEPDMEVEEDGIWRWWTGMKKSEEDY